MHILFSLWLARAQALAPGAYPEQAFRAAGIERIEISGVRGRVKLRGSTSPLYRLRVRHSTAKIGADWGLSVDRRGTTLVLEVYNVAYGAEWRRVVNRDQWPAFDIELTGPARPTTVGWRSGAIEVSDWRAKLDASLLDGRIEVTGSAGVFNLQAARADVAVDRFNGDLTVRGEEGRLNLARVNGTAHLHWFGGELSLARFAGRIDVESERARVRGRDISGKSSFRVTSGDVELERVAGQCEGRGSTTPWRVATRDRANVHIHSSRGAVSVTPRGPTELVLSSKLGRIGGVPWPLKLEGAFKVAKGRLGATLARAVGRIIVRTESGAVHLLDRPRALIP